MREIGSVAPEMLARRRAGAAAAAAGRAAPAVGAPAGTVTVAARAARAAGAALGLALALALGAAAGAAETPGPFRGERFTIAFPEGWEIADTGDRVRAIPPDSPSRRDPPIFVEVQTIPADAGGLDSLLGEEDGLARWLAATRRELTIAGRERAGAHAVLVAEEGRRRLLAVHARAGEDFHLVLIAAAPRADFERLRPIFRKVIESFEGGRA